MNAREVASDSIKSSSSSTPTSPTPSLSTTRRTQDSPELAPAKTNNYYHCSRSMTSTITSTSVSDDDDYNEECNDSDNSKEFVPSLSYNSNNYRDRVTSTAKTNKQTSPRSVTKVLSDDDHYPDQLAEDGKPRPSFPAATLSLADHELPWLMNIEPRFRNEQIASNHVAVNHSTMTFRTHTSYNRNENKIKDSHQFHDNMTKQEFSNTIPSTNTYYHSIIHFIGGTITAIAVIQFSFWLPFGLDYEAARRTYYYAQFRYDPKYSEFDNTAWTYGTDYIIAIAMMVSAYMICQTNKQQASVVNRLHQNYHATEFSTNRIVLMSAGLLLMYMLSVIAGGIAHQYFLTIDDQNTTTFRIIWTICVGFVAAASGLMGMIGTEYLRQNRNREQLLSRNLFDNGKQQPQQLPLLTTSRYIIPDAFWIGYAICTTMTVVLGYFSYQSQAGDLFLVGITQFPSTFYLIFVLVWGIPPTGSVDRLQNKNGTISNNTVPTPTMKTVTSSSIVISPFIRLLGCVAFLLNAPLLPLYPTLIHSFTLPVVNTILHTWLFVSWNLQGYCMKHIVASFQIQPQESEKLFSSKAL